MSNIVKREEILDSFIISEYTKLEDLLKKSVENDFISDTSANEIALNFFSDCVKKAKEYREEVEYIDQKEIEQLIQNYLKIVGIYLSTYKNSEAFEMLVTKSSTEILKSAIKYYENSNIDAYNKLDYALSIFQPIKNRESLVLIKRLMLMYKIFDAHLVECDVETVSVNSDIIVYENLNTEINDLLYSDIKGITGAGGFINYIKAADNIFYEAKIIDAFDSKEIVKLINNTSRKIEIEHGIIIDDPLSNITWLVLKQFIISSYYHKVIKEPLTLSLGEAKVALWEILKELIEPEEFFESLCSNQIYLNYDEATQKFILSLIDNFKYEFNKLKKERVNYVITVNE